MIWKNRGRYRRTRLAMRRRFNAQCEAFEAELAELIARLREQEQGARVA